MATNQFEDLSASECCSQARKLWLSGSSDLIRVEKLYRKALKATKTSNSKTNGKRRRILQLSKSEYKAAGEKLALLLCQSGQWEKAQKGLTSMGYRCRLASCVLDYPEVRSPSTSSQSPPCRVYDNFLSEEETAILKEVFEDRGASYWIDHGYEVEPPSPYFSYVVPLEHATSDFGFIGHLMHKCRRQLQSRFPDLEEAKHVEMWAHNRPHASGHQMHFDSDNEGIGGVRNPIISTILYITGGVGGPSLVTNQTLNDRRIANKGWMSHPREKRLVAFDGRVLHGVVPGKGCKTGRRVTLMFAFWKDIELRGGNEPVAARQFPMSSEWASLLRQDFACTQSTQPTPVEPIEVDRVYEKLDGTEWKLGLPNYDVVFQGF